MNKKTFLGGLLALMALFFIACNDDDDNKHNVPTLRMDKTSFAVPFNEDLLKATLYIDPMPENKDLYELKLDASKLEGPLAFPSITAINATKNSGEYQLLIDRKECIGTFNIKLVEKQTEATVASVSFDVEELKNEYSIYPGITVNIDDEADWDKEWNVDLKELYKHYPELNLSSILLYSPDKKEWTKESNFLLPQLNSQEKKLTVTNIIDEDDANQPKGIWEFRLKGESKEYKEIIVHIYFQVK